MNRYTARLSSMEDVLNKLTSDLAQEIKKPYGQVRPLLGVLSLQAADADDIF